MKIMTPTVSVELPTIFVVVAASTSAIGVAVSNTSSGKRKRFCHNNCIKRTDKQGLLVRVNMINDLEWNPKVPIEVDDKCEIHVWALNCGKDDSDVAIYPFEMTAEILHLFQQECNCGCESGTCEKSDVSQTSETQTSGKKETSEMETKKYTGPNKLHISVESLEGKTQVMASYEAPRGAQAFVAELFREGEMESVWSGTFPIVIPGKLELKLTEALEKDGIDYKEGKHKLVIKMTNGGSKFDPIEESFDMPPQGSVENPASAATSEAPSAIIPEVVSEVASASAVPAPATDTAAASPEATLASSSSAGVEPSMSAVNDTELGGQLDADTSSATTGIEPPHCSIEGLGLTVTNQDDVFKKIVVSSKKSEGGKEVISEQEGTMAPGKDFTLWNLARMFTWNMSEINSDEEVMLDLFVAAVNENGDRSTPVKLELKLTKSMMQQIRKFQMPPVAATPASPDDRQVGETEWDRLSRQMTTVHKSNMGIRSVVDATRKEVEGLKKLVDTAILKLENVGSTVERLETSGRLPDSKLEKFDAQLDRLQAIIKGIVPVTAGSAAPSKVEVSNAATQVTEVLTAIGNLEINLKQEILGLGRLIGTMNKGLSDQIGDVKGDVSKVSSQVGSLGGEVATGFKNIMDGLGKLLKNQPAAASTPVATGAQVPSKETPTTDNPQPIKGPSTVTTEVIETETTKPKGKVKKVETVEGDDSTWISRFKGAITSDFSTLLIIVVVLVISIIGIIVITNSHGERLLNTAHQPWPQVVSVQTTVPAAVLPPATPAVTPPQKETPARRDTIPSSRRPIREEGPAGQRQSMEGYVAPTTGFETVRTDTPDERMREVPNQPAAPARVVYVGTTAPTIYQQLPEYERVNLSLGIRLSDGPHVPHAVYYDRGYRGGHYDHYQAAPQKVQQITQNTYIDKSRTITRTDIDNSVRDNSVRDNSVRGSYRSSSSLTVPPPPTVVVPSVQAPAPKSNSTVGQGSWGSGVIKGGVGPSTGNNAYSNGSPQGTGQNPVRRGGGRS